MTYIKMILDKELVNQFNDYLNKKYGTYTVAGHDYLASDILKKNDPIAYRDVFSQWLDNQLNEDVFKEDANGNFYTEE